MNAVSKLSVLVLLCLVSIPVAFAYTGSFAFAPALTGGPDTKTTTMFDVDTGVENPQELLTDLNFVYKIIVETSEPESGPLHVKEYPDGDDPAWDIIVPKKLNDVLIKATIYFWGPSTGTTMTIVHQHAGEPDEYLTATIVSPTVLDASGRALWVFETTSFSSFYVNHKPDHSLNLPYLFITLITLCSALPVVVLRRN